MSKVLLALIVLGAGASGFLAARHSTAQLARETRSNREAWLLQTQQLAVIQSEQADLVVRLREVKASLTQFPTAVENPLWSALRTSRADRLPPEMRERVLEELGFNWQASPDFIVVTKQAVRDSGTWMLRGGKVSEVAAIVLAMTPEERRQIESALQRAEADYSEWATAHVERKEPTGNEVAHYFLFSNTGGLLPVTTKLNAGIRAAVGGDRSGLMTPTEDWVVREIAHNPVMTTMVIKRELTGNEPRLKAEIDGDSDPVNPRSGYLPEFAFPESLRPVFPNGWADVAKREGFELPPAPEKK
jgi:hypothetical protein